MKVKSESEFPQSCLIPSDPTDCSLPGSSVHGIFQARVLEWGALLSRSSYIQDAGQTMKTNNPTSCQKVVSAMKENKTIGVGEGRVERG